MIFFFPEGASVASAKFILARKKAVELQEPVGLQWGKEQIIAM